MEKNTARAQSIEAATSFLHGVNRVGRDSRVFRCRPPPTDTVAVAQPPPTGQRAIRQLATRASRQRATAARRLSVFRYSQCDVDDDSGVGCDGGGWGGLHVRLSDWV